MGSDRTKRKVRGGSLLGNDWEQKTRAKIQAGGIVKRLILFVNGKISLEPAQVTAGLGLLKKVLPDTVFVEHSGEVKHSVIRAPAVSTNLNDWERQHVPEQYKTEH
jgi:hypothetical protein